MYDELIAEMRMHHCDAKEDDTQEVCEECSYDVIIADKSVPSGIASVCVCGLMHRAADAIEELEGKHFMMKKTAEWLAEKVPHWIPVTERLPKEETPVQVTYLGYNDKKPRTDMIACLYCGYWCYWDGAPCGYNKCKVEVTHWMPLQPAPKEENKCKSGNM